MKRKIYVFTIVIGLWGCNGKTEQNRQVTDILDDKTKLNSKEIAQLDSLNIDFQLRADCYAYSSDKNAESSNGEAHSDNLPRKVDGKFSRQGFYLVINQDEFSVIDSSILGCKLYLINTSDDKVKIEASDSRLFIIAEALNDRNEWTPITYFPSSKCGNSYHTVILDKAEYWKFNIPIFKGNFKTKLRYTLTIDTDKKISSNEITAFINKGQFDTQRKQGHSNNNIMDPYSE
jgi:hypothetical protein